MGALQKSIRMWAFDEAPESLRAYAGDAAGDWVALVPPHLAPAYREWLGAPGFAGPVTEHPQVDGHLVLIGRRA